MYVTEGEGISILSGVGDEKKTFSQSHLRETHRVSLAFVCDAASVLTLLIPGLSLPSVVSLPR